MPIIRGSRNVTTISGGDLSIALSHTNDSVTLGDETNKMVLQDIGGVFAVPTKIIGDSAGLATNATLTGGTVKTQLTDASANVGEFDDIGGEKAFKVSVISSVGGGAAPSETDGAAFTADSSVFTPIGAVFDDVTPTALGENEMGTVRCTSARSLHVHMTGSDVGTGLTDAELRATDVDVNVTNASFAVTGTFWQATQPVSGTFWQATQPVSIADPVAVTGTFWQATQPVSLLSVPTHAVTQSGTWDIGSITNLPSIPAGTNNIGDVDVLTLPGITGAAAHDAAVSGNPVRIGGRAMLANGTAVAEDDTADIATDNQGRVLTTPHVPRDLVVQNAVTQSSTTEATLLSAGAAGIFHDITKLVMTNSSSTAVRVQIRDATAGSIILEVALAANGGAVLDFGTVPLKQTTAANNWTIDLSAAVSDIYCFVQAIKRIA